MARSAHEVIRQRRLAARAAVAARLRLARGPRSVEDIAADTGFPAPTIYRYEAGAMLPGLDVVPILARAYRISVRWLVTGEGDPMPEAVAS